MKLYIDREDAEQECGFDLPSYLPRMDYKLTRVQSEFMSCGHDGSLYAGNRSGLRVLLLDTLRAALIFPRCRQLLLCRQSGEREIAEAMTALYPHDMFIYDKHTRAAELYNGSSVYFNEPKGVYRPIAYDFVRFYGLSEYKLTEYRRVVSKLDRNSLYPCQIKIIAS